MKKIGILLLTGLMSQIVIADDQTSTFMPLPVVAAQEPVQQFVSSDTSISVESSGAASAESGVSPPPTVLVPAPSPPPNVVTPAPSSTTALGSNASEEPTENPLAGGIDIHTFLSCQQTTIAMCQRAHNLAEFQECFKRVRTPVCNAFFAFATKVGMAPKDAIDVIKHYDEGQLDLIHLVRFGTNYPGVYYTVGIKGDITDLIFGPQNQKLDIRKDVHYPEIAQRFPNTQLFSIVDSFPTVEANPNGDGNALRLVLRYQLMNGCYTCARAGYANVAYDFTDMGALHDVSILSLDPLF